MSLKLVQLNMQGHVNLERILPFLQAQQPDVVCFQELFAVDVPVIAQTLGTLGTPGTLGTLGTLGMRNLFVPMATVSEPNPHVPDLLGEIGVGIFTHLPIENSGHFFYVKHGEATPIFFHHQDSNALNRVVLWVELREGGGEGGARYRLATTHFTWSSEGQSTPLQHQNLDTLLGFLQTLPDFVLCGDLNAPRGGEIFARLAERYRDHIPPEVLSTLDPVLHKVGSEVNLMVDGLFSTPDYQVERVQVVPGLSDHQAVVAEITRI